MPYENKLICPFPSPYMFGVQNENSSTEYALLHKIGATKKKVLHIASCGDNALCMLSREDVGSLVSMDISPSQLHLCELKRIAIQNLSRGEIISLVGLNKKGDEPEEVAAERIKLYERIRDKLPEETQKFWDSNKHVIKFSTVYTGIFSIYVSYQESFKKLGIDPKDVVENPEKYFSQPNFEQNIKSTIKEVCREILKPIFSSQVRFHKYFSFQGNRNARNQKIL